jgi:hypothetical protein
MKRHFSNRGEALSEVTAARGLADRKAWIRASFMTQANRRTNSPFWSMRQEEVPNPPRRKQPRQKEEVTLLL